MRRRSRVTDAKAGGVICLFKTFRIQEWNDCSNPWGGRKTRRQSKRYVKEQSSTFASHGLFAWRAKFPLKCRFWTELYNWRFCFLSCQLLSSCSLKHYEENLDIHHWVAYLVCAEDCCRCWKGDCCLLAALTASSQKFSTLVSSALSSSSSSSTNEGCAGGGLEGDAPQMFPDLLLGPQVADSEPPVFPHTEELKGLWLG